MSRDMEREVGRAKARGKRQKQDFMNIVVRLRLIGMKIANLLLLLGVLVFVIALLSLISKILGTFGLPWEIQALIVGLFLILTASWIIKLNR